MRRSIARRGTDVCVPEPHMNLPESCISTILSFTTPRDVSRLAAISKLFRSAADSDSVWNKFIPPQCYEILPRAVMHIQFNSKRELYFRLCHTILIDSGIKRFWLERSTGKIGYMLSARTLGIDCGNDHQQFGVSPWQGRWRWAKHDGSRLLSADRKYRVVFVIKLIAECLGFDGRPVKFSVKAPGMEEMGLEHLLPVEKRIYRMRAIRWMEVVAGEFTVRAAENMDDVSSHIQFRMKSVEPLYQKGGLLVDGVKIEPRPI